MKRQAVRTNRLTGRIEHHYVDCGPQGAVVGHGRPTFEFHGSVTRPNAPLIPIYGRQQLRLYPRGT